MLLLLVVGLAVILIPLALFYLNKASKEIDKNVYGENYKFRKAVKGLKKYHWSTSSRYSCWYGNVWYNE